MHDVSINVVIFVYKTNLPFLGTLNLRSLCCGSPLTYKNIISLILIKYFRERFVIVALQLPDE